MIYLLAFLWVLSGAIGWWIVIRYISKVFFRMDIFVGLLISLFGPLVFIAIFVILGFTLIDKLLKIFVKADRYGVIKEWK